jgi:hypothetical protein
MRGIERLSLRWSYVIQRLRFGSLRGGRNGTAVRSGHVGMSDRSVPVGAAKSVRPLVRYKIAWSAILYPHTGVLFSSTYLLRGYST